MDANRHTLVVGQTRLVHLLQEYPVINRPLGVAGWGQAGSYDRDRVAVLLAPGGDGPVLGVEVAHVLPPVHWRAGPLPAQIRLVPDFDGVDGRAECGEDVIDEVSQILRVAGRAVLLRCWSGPVRRFGDADHDQEVAAQRILHVQLKLTPVISLDALAIRLHLIPGELHLDPFDLQLRGPVHHLLPVLLGDARVDLDADARRIKAGRGSRGDGGSRRHGRRSRDGRVRRPGSGSRR